MKNHSLKIKFIKIMLSVGFILSIDANPFRFARIVALRSRLLVTDFRFALAERRLARIYADETLRNKYGWNRRDFRASEFERDRYEKLIKYLDGHNESLCQEIDQLGS